MRPAYFEVLSAAEVEKIHAASMDILGSVGLRVDLKRARDVFREAGARVDDLDDCRRTASSVIDRHRDQRSVGRPTQVVDRGKRNLPIVHSVCYCARTGRLAFCGEAYGACLLARSCLSTCSGESCGSGWKYF